MINTEDEVCYDLRSSCTEEEAVAMMLGWLRGERRTRYIQVTLDGINPDQLPYLSSLPDTLEATIREQREKASIKFHNAVVNGEIAIAVTKDATVDDWDKIAKRARRYMIDIGDELTKTDSALRVDQHTTTASGITHITLKSLDHWSRKEYGIAILDNEPLAINADTPSAESILPDQSPEARLTQTPKAPEHPGRIAPSVKTRTKIDFLPASSTTEKPSLPIPINAASSSFNSRTPPAGGVTQKPKQRRFDLLAAEIDQILCKYPDSTPNQVMVKLLARSGMEGTCVQANVGDGIKWEDSNGTVRHLKSSALAERIRQLKRKRLFQG